IEGITQGTYIAAKERINLYMSKHPPQSVNGQSTQEVYVHEMVHAVSKRVLETAPKLKARLLRLQKLSKQLVDKDGGYKVFLGDIVNPDKNDITLAKAQYEHVFNTTSEHREMHEFLAYTLTNPVLAKYLSTKKRPFKIDKITSGNILDTLVRILEMVVNTFTSIGKQSRDKNIQAETLVIFEHMIDVQNKHKTILDTLGESARKVFDKSDVKIRNASQKAYNKTMNIDSSARPVKYLKGVAGAARLAVSDRVYNAHVTDAMHTVFNKEIMDTIKEMQGGVLSSPLIFQLLRTKNQRDKARQTHERLALEQFDAMWKSTEFKDVSAKTKEAMTRVLYKADVSSIVGINGLSAEKIMSILNNVGALRLEKEKIRKQLSIPKSSNTIQYANELGNYIVTHDTYLAGGFDNALQILLEYDDSPNETRLQLLDAYTSLHALERLNALNARDITLVKQLATAEFNTDKSENGITDLLSHHRLYVENSERVLFKNNPSQMSKGWVTERLDNFTQMKVGFAYEAESMKKKGYTQSYNLTNVTGSESAPSVMYISTFMPEARLISGMISTSSNKHTGTTISDMLKADPDFQKPDKTPDIKLINDRVKELIKKHKREAGKVTPNTKLKLRPLRDDQGNIVDLRVIMSYQAKEKLLRPDQEAQNVFAHMRSSFVDKEHALKMDIEAINHLVKEQQEMYPLRKSAFVNLLDKDSPYTEQYYRIPKEVRDYIDQFAVNGEFMVREEIIHKVFGYAAKDIRNTKFLQKEGNENLQRLAGLVQEIVKDVVGYSTLLIVIATPPVVFGNVVTNLGTLLLNKIPITYTLPKMYEGFKENQRFEKDRDEYLLLKSKLDAAHVPENDPQRNRLQLLLSSMQNNKVYDMTAAGLNTLLVEDVNLASSNGILDVAHKHLKDTKYMQYASTKTPKTVQDMGSLLWMTARSAPHKFLKDIVQLTDFLGRYVWIEHAINVKGHTKERAMIDAVKAFTNFDENLPPMMEYVNAMGAGIFLKYKFRNLPAAVQLIKNNPTTTALAATVQNFTGLPVTANIDNTALTGNPFPMLGQTDDLFDRAIGIPAYDALKDIFMGG
ncbi:MAG: hypothetical protein U9O94_06350, partial [Nanoarchaeota archaeon]|nr:hypothetical protein [Nanoarchaeota archaeon]